MSPEADPAVPAEAATVPGTGAVDGEEGATTRVPGFSVTLPQFEGPFDLLLSLIARRRLDVTELALAEVTDEFIAHMRSDWDLGRASEFLVVASTLLALKAHRLLPHDSEDEEEDLDLLEARDLLFARLLQYRAYKQAARQLSDMASAASHSHPRVVGPAPEFAALLPEGATAEEVTLLQRDDDADITLSVTDLGKPAKPAKDYYAGLKSALEAGGLADLKVGAATENRMDYSFSYPDGGGENCIAIYHPENLYTVCAASATAAAPQLADTLKDVKLLKKAM